MKEFLILLLSASLALPGCVSQRRTAIEMAKAQLQVDAIVATLDTVHPVTELNATILPMLDAPDNVFPTLPAPTTAFTLPADTAVMTFDVNKLPIEGKIIDTGTQTLSVKPVTDATGAVSISIESVSKAKPVQVYIPEPTQPVETPKADLYHIILFLIAGMGMAAQMLIKWLERKRNA